jgi:hypothetical protein
MKRTWKLTLALAVLLSSLTTLWLLPPPASPVTRTAFERLKPGMSLAKVEGILGGPPGDYMTGEPDDYVFESLYNPMQDIDVPHEAARLYEHAKWTGDEGLAWVCFDRGGRVVHRAFTPWQKKAITPLERLRRWFKRWGR